ncbi:MAG: TetR/AcrR family transcriptional regulator [Deltaproteobacteria bacterium]|nr:TetR/AcrR family transcriptional regulator [Deltaproteobacteria bacterium]MBW2291259.1 TetR/AcrR family transcriptional regulator [Deltaproteobacteria bacterium]MBW2391463.1 TetR/AcrR family transcriptional regulator [Deltaproteobacteria bacterium]MBW2723724.1 TetR/AcrR family transcriptional regulator [Deltaproteobacteria bacterium]
MTRAATARVVRLSGRRVRTRALLIEAARRIAASRGIEATPISEITDEAGVGVGSFYNHFATKEELLEAVIADTFEAHGAALDRIHEGKDDIAEILAQNIRLTLRMVDHDPIWGWFAVRTGLYAPQLQSSLGGRLERDLQRGFDAGRFASYDERTTVAAFGGALLGVMRTKLEGDLPRNADRFLAEELLRLLGLSPKEAKEIAGRRLPPIARLISEAAAARTAAASRGK